MRNYEFMFILNPDLIAEDRDTLISEMKEEFKTANIKIVGEDDWGVKDLAYKIKGSKTGHYFLYKLECDGRQFFDISKSFNLKKDIWRYMFKKLED